MKLSKTILAAAAFASLAAVSTAHANCEKPTGEIAKLLSNVIGKDAATKLDCANEKLDKPAEKAGQAILTILLGG